MKLLDNFINKIQWTLLLQYITQTFRSLFKGGINAVQFGLNYILSPLKQYKNVIYWINFYKTLLTTCCHLNNSLQRFVRVIHSGIWQLDAVYFWFRKRTESLDSLYFASTITERITQFFFESLLHYQTTLITLYIQ